MTLRELIVDALSRNNDNCLSIDRCISVDVGTDIDAVLKPARDGYYMPDFGLWTSGYVYFPFEYDGELSIRWVPRFKTSKPIERMG